MSLLKVHQTHSTMQDKESLSLYTALEVPTAIRTFVGRSLVVNVLYLIYAIAICELLAQALDLPQLLKMRFISLKRRTSSLSELQPPLSCPGLRMPSARTDVPAAIRCLTRPALSPCFWLPFRICSSSQLSCRRTAWWDLPCHVTNGPGLPGPSAAWLWPPTLAPTTCSLPRQRRRLAVAG
jgi:hypothetical protein